MKINTPDKDTLNAGPDEYVRCRTYGHSWVEAPSDWADPDDKFGIPDTVRCRECKTERRDTLRPNGSLLRRHYVYPANYLLAKGVHRPKRDDFRLRLLALRLKALRK